MHRLILKQNVAECIKKKLLAHLKLRDTARWNCNNCSAAWTREGQGNCLVSVIIVVNFIF